MENHCVKCNSDNIIYGGFEVQDNYGYYEYTCQDCEYEGKEYYKLVYDGSD